MIHEQAKTLPCLHVGEYTAGMSINVRKWGNQYAEMSQIYIGKFCSIADNVTMFTGGNHLLNLVSTNSFYQLTEKGGASVTKGDVVIGNDVWIGSGVTILSGAHISDGAVLGACSVVRGYIPPYAIAIGNPAKAVRFRCSPEEIIYLLKLKWWDWPIEKITKEIPHTTIKQLMERFPL